VDAAHHRRKTCRLCASTDLTKVLSLAPTPPANAFVPEAALGHAQRTFPLDMFFCETCAHAQLLDVVDPSALFEDYVYVSGTSPVFVRHFQDYAEAVARLSGLGPDDLVVDVGSNDGTLLAAFRERGARILGIDPARDIAKKASEGGIETLNGFFTPDLAAGIRAERGPATVVTANNVFAHIDDLRGVVDGVRSLLRPDGIFVFEVSYLVDVLEKTLFDTIYHEHLDYHSVKPLARFFAAAGMELIRAERVETHGGSLRGTAQVIGGPRVADGSVEDLTALEERLGLDRAETLQAFSRDIDALGADLRATLNRLKAQGRSIAGFGAPAKATTLMHHFGIGADMIDYIVDDSPLKQGLFTPGHHIPVVSSDMIADNRPDYLLILAWNFAEPIMAKHAAFHDAGGRFIIPVPKTEIV
jgi:SAM-dependent methyltransferase